MESFQGPSHIYRRLQDAEIRLVKIKPFRPGDDENCIEAKLFHAVLDSNAAYYALSYVWGDASRTRPISLDGHAFDVTLNLWEALASARNHYYPERKPQSSDDGNDFPPFIFEQANQRCEDDEDWVTEAPGWWIDALCINQRDHDERSRQVPRMAAIFGTASHVVIRLGPPNIHPDERGDRVVDAAEAYHAALSATGKQAGDVPADQRVQVLRKLGLNLDELVQPLADCFWGSETSYFGRVWTVQEVLVAKRDPAVIIGRRTTTLRRLELLREVLGLVVLKGGLQRPLPPWRYGQVTHRLRLRRATPWPAAAAAASSSPTSLRGGNYYNYSDELSNFGLELYALLAHFSPFRVASNPHDRIYGLLGLTSLPALTENLVPDYNIPFEKVCYEYTKFLVQTTGRLEILGLGVNRHATGPTWVPSFLGIDTGTPRTRQMEEVIFSDDGRCMTVSGVHLGTITAVHSCAKMREALGRRRTPVHVVFSAWRELVLTVLQPAAQIQGLTLEAIVSEWACNLYVDMLGEDVGWLLCTLHDVLGADNSIDNATRLWGHAVLRCVPSLSLLFRSVSFALLDDGRFCHCLHRPEFPHDKPLVGDVVCALRGASTHTLLRPLPGRDGFSVQGTCLVYPVEDTQTDQWFSCQTETLFKLF